MTETVDLSQWIIRAEEDYQLCLSCLRRKEPLIYGATFHAQQCVEKYLKSLLIKNHISFPKTHDLAALNRLVSMGGIKLPVEDDDLEVLSAYAVEARYPGALPTLDEAKRSKEIAKTVRKIIRKFL